MGMSTHAIGFRPPDDLWKRHKAVWDACLAAGIQVSPETVRFFGHKDPDPAGVEVKIEGTACVKEWRDDSREGLEIDVSLLPPDVKIVRVYNAW